MEDLVDVPDVLAHKEGAEVNATPGLNSNAGANDLDDSGLRFLGFMRVGLVRNLEPEADGVALIGNMDDRCAFRHPDLVVL